MTNAGEGMEEREPPFTAAGDENWSSHHGQHTEVSQSTNSGITIRFIKGNPTPGSISRQHDNSRRSTHPLCAQRHCSRTPRQESNLKACQQMKGWKDVALQCHGIPLRREKERNDTTGSSTDATRNYHTEGSKSERERRTPYHLYTESEARRERTHLWNGHRTTEIGIRLAVTKGKQAGETEWEAGVRRCKLLYTGWINNQVLLYSKHREYVQYPLINHSGKEHLKRMNAEFLCCTAEIHTTLQINYMSIKILNKYK